MPDIIKKSYKRRETERNFEPHNVWGKCYITTWEQMHKKTLDTNPIVHT